MIELRIDWNEYLCTHLYMIELLIDWNEYLCTQLYMIELLIDWNEYLCKQLFMIELRIDWNEYLCTQLYMTELLIDWNEYQVMDFMVLNSAEKSVLHFLLIMLGYIKSALRKKQLITSNAEHFLENVEKVPWFWENVPRLWPSIG